MWSRAVLIMVHELHHQHNMSKLSLKAYIILEIYVFHLLRVVRLFTPWWLRYPNGYMYMWKFIVSVYAMASPPSS